MRDEGNAQGSGTVAEGGPATTAGSRAGYCQECGLPLTTTSLRRVQDGVFCQSCAEMHRPGSASGWQQVHTAGYQGSANQTPFTPNRNGGANPVLAGLLGFVPGVGAMYNSQYAKGAMHLIVFVVLVALADNLNWVLWWLVWGWIFYQVFDAYHTARARRDFLPLPNPFGWNDLAERTGFTQAPPTSAATAMPGAATAYSSRPVANWAGYVSPNDPSTPPYSPVAEHTGDNPYTAPYTSPFDAPSTPVTPVPQPATNVPYAPAYTGVAAGIPTVAPPPRIAGSRRFPVGAAWLIGLGVIFLTGNVMPALRVHGAWFAPLLLAALALWIAGKRWNSLREGRPGCGRYSTLPHAMTGPIILLTVSLLLSLQAADMVSMRRSWPVLPVLWGVMLLLQRSTDAVPQSSRLLVPEPFTPPPAVPPIRSTSGTGSLGL